MNRRLSASVLALALSGLTVGAVGTASASSDTASGSGERFPIRIAIQSPPGTLDPALALGNALVMGRFLYDPLVNLTAAGEVVSGLASDWELTETGAVFTLRDDVTCSDGSPLTASDVKAWFDHLQDPATNPPIMLTHLGGNPFTTSADDEAGTFTITLDQSFAFLLPGLTNVGIVCASGLADVDALLDSAQGTGPYVIDSINPDIEYRLKLREDYSWGPGGVGVADLPAMPSEVIMTVVSSPDTAANMMLREEIDLFGGPASVRSRLESESTVTITDVNIDSQYFFPNQREGLVLHDRAVREALAVSIDRDAWGAVATGNAYAVTNSLTTATPVVCADPLTQAAVPTGDVDAANALLDGAGWVRGDDGNRAKDGVPLNLTILAFEGSAPQWEYAQQVWADLGITSTLDIRERSDYSGTMYSGVGWDITYIEVGTNMPSLWLALFDSPDPDVFAGIDNPAYDELAQQAMQTPGEEGCGLWDQAGAEIMSATNVSPLVTMTTYLFSSPGVAFETTEFYYIPTSLEVTS